jgi:alpha-ribazole phosphatase/probable phosphoglycerate mutase
VYDIIYTKTFDIPEDFFVAKKHLFFVRHGKTEWNGQYRFQGRSDVPLNEEGQKQAEALAVRIRTWKDACFFTSTLSRAAETARILSSGCRSERLEKREGLSEMSFGVWEGLSIFEAETADPDAFRKWKQSPFEHIPPGGEPYPEIMNRVSAVLDEALSSKEERIVLVSHGGIIRAALSILLGLSPSSVWKMKLSNCSVTAVESGKRGCSLVFLNDDLHTLLSSEILPDIPFPA